MHAKFSYWLSQSSYIKFQNGAKIGPGTKSFRNNDQSRNYYLGVVSFRNHFALNL